MRKALEDAFKNADERTATALQVKPKGFPSKKHKPKPLRVKAPASAPVHTAKKSPPSKSFCFIAGKYHDQDTGKERWAVYCSESGVWYFPDRYGKREAERLASRMNREESARDLYA